MTKKNFCPLGCFLGFLFVGGISLWAMPPGDLKDPAKTLARSRVPLEAAESFLVLQETGAVKAYRENLIARGKEDAAHRVRFLEELFAGNNGGALQELGLIKKKKEDWVAAREKYLTGLMEIQRSFTDARSEHFIVRAPAEDNFLARYALPSMESAYGRAAEFFGSSTTSPGVIEIYPTVEAFAFAAALPKEDVERTGSVVTVRYGRIMVLSPGATAFGYRWLDAMAHAYAHQQLNRVSGGNAPAWLQEGAARYLTAVWRRPEGFVHSPSDRALLTRAVLSDVSTAGGLLPFERMEAPSLKSMSHAQRTLAFAETADAVDFMVQEFGVEKLRALVPFFRAMSPSESFQNALGMSESDFEKSWRDSLTNMTDVPTDLARGALDGTVRFGQGDDVQRAGDPVRALLIQGDEYRKKGQLNSAVTEYKKAIDLEPDNGVALARLADAYATAQKIESAEELLKRAMDKNPAYSTPFVLAGTLYFDDGRYEDAQQVLQQALEINPFQPKIHEILGLIAVDVGNFVLAKQSLELALRFDPANGSVRQSLEHMPKPR